VDDVIGPDTTFAPALLFNLSYSLRRRLVKGFAIASNLATTTLLAHAVTISM
jgi:hypothetical protein